MKHIYEHMVRDNKCENGKQNSEDSGPGAGFYFQMPLTDPVNPK